MRLFLYLLFVFSALNILGQTKEVKRLQVLPFNNKPVFYRPLLINNPFVAVPSDKQLPVVENTVHYTAFFCKMEVAFHQRYNFWLKIHAGDYDTYSKPVE